MFLCLMSYKLNMFLCSYVKNQSVATRFCLFIYHSNAPTAVRNASRSLTGRLAHTPSNPQMPGKTSRQGRR